MVGKFVILPDDNIKNNCLIINQRIHEKQITVAPCHSEHWISTDLFKFRIYCERNKLHVIGVCSMNQIPSFSLFCDEIRVVESCPKWYVDHSKNGVRRGDVSNHVGYKDIEGYRAPGGKGGTRFRQEFTSEVSDEEVVDQFHDSTMYFLESGWNTFCSIRKELPTNVIIAEIKQKRHRAIIDDLERVNWIYRSSIRHKFQKNLVQKVGTHHYMTVQILASNFLNWQFVCVGGSSNLMCILPVRVFSLFDQLLCPSVINVVRGLALRKHGIEDLPHFDYKISGGMVDKTFATLSNDYSLPKIVISGGRSMNG